MKDVYVVIDGAPLHLGACEVEVNKGSLVIEDPDVVPVIEETDGVGWVNQS